MKTSRYGLLVVLALLCGCQNRYAQAYKNLMAPGTELYLGVHNGAPEIQAVAAVDLSSAYARLERRGYVVIGHASFVADEGDYTDELRTQAQAVQADVVLTSHSEAGVRQEVQTQEDYNPSANIGATTGGQVSSGGNARMGAGTSPYMGPVNSGAIGNLTPAYNVRTVSQHKYTAFFLRKRAFVLGANVKEFTATERSASSLPTGVTVISVVEDSPADRAGILPGDILTAVEGKTFGTEVEYQKLLNALSGGPVHISLVRHGAEQTVVTRLNPLPPQR